MSLTTHPYAKTIFNLLFADIQNKKGVAALMGNLQAESGLYPDRVQGDIPYSDYSKTYTANVDSGAVTENDFVNNGPNGGGYGLAQWTYYSRKQNLYDKWKSGGYSSIGDVNLACDFLLWELKNSYPAIYSALKTCIDIRTASDIVLHDFENPADQSESVELTRYNMGLTIYNTFSGSSSGGESGGGESGGGTTTQTTSKKLSKLLLYAIATD